MENWVVTNDSLIGGGVSLYKPGIEVVELATLIVLGSMIHQYQASAYRAYHH